MKHPLYIPIVYALCAVSPGLAAPKTEPTRLDIASEPSGAEVLIDHRPRGITPLRIEIAPGKHLVTLRLQGHDPEHRPVHVAPGERPRIHFNLQAQKGLLLVHSTPTNAEITVEGLLLGHTPALITSLPLGEHRLEIATPGYQPKTVSVTLSDRTPRRVAVDLASDSGTLRIESIPPGAEIRVNGIARGSTPCTVERIPEGETLVEAQAEGYRPSIQRLRLAAGEIQELRIALQPQPASLDVVSLPARARVYCNNAFRGETPLILPDLTPGEYRLRVERDGYDSLARTVTLSMGENRTEEFRLRSNTGRLLLTTEPPGVTVFIDGQEQGITPEATGASPLISAPLSIEMLAVGERVLKGMRTGYYEAMKPVTIKREETTTLHLKLERRFIPDYEIETARGVYRGMFVSETDEVIRMETAPGVVMPFFIKDIRRHQRLEDKE